MSETQPKVSVVVPNFNYAKYLDQRMETILNQTYQDFEVIILDDKSTDNSREVIEKYRNHPKMREIVYNERNTGSPCKQWKKGCDMARGEYVWIAEADDFCELTFLEKAVSALEANANADLFYSGSYQNWDDANDTKFVNRRFDRWALPKFALPKGETYYVFDGPLYLENYLSFNNSIYNASGALFRRLSADAQAWEYVDSFYCLGDWALWSYIIGKSKVIICPEPLNRFRMHAKSATKKFSKEYANLLDAFRLIYTNSRTLSQRKRYVRLMRLYKGVPTILGHGKRWRSFNENIAETYGDNFMKEVKKAYYINKLLTITPWHIGSTEARRFNPKLGRQQLLPRIVY